MVLVFRAADEVLKVTIESENFVLGCQVARRALFLKNACGIEGVHPVFGTGGHGAQDALALDWHLEKLLEGRLTALGGLLGKGAVFEGRNVLIAPIHKFRPRLLLESWRCMEYLLMHFLVYVIVVFSDDFRGQVTELQI